MTSLRPSWWQPARVRARRHEARAARLVMELVRRSDDPNEREPVEQRLLQIALRETGATGGVALRYRAGRFVTEASAGTIAPALQQRYPHGVPYGDTAIWTARREGRPIYLNAATLDAAQRRTFAELGIGAVALVPVARDGVGEELVLALYNDRPREWSTGTRILLDGITDVLLTTIIQRDTERRLAELVRLQRELLATPIDTMVQTTLEAAMRTVRTADAGSLLVRGDDGWFRYVAAVGFDLDGLADLRFSVEDMQTWHGASGEPWASGQPRILVSTPDRSIGDVSALTLPRDLMRSAGRVDEIAADLSLPIAYRGEVLAVLNLDSLHDPNAFGATATRAASDLAPAVAFLLHEAATRTRLDRVARTDELTGLGNRRAFNEQAARELALASRHGHELTLVVLDLSRFKHLNDTLGHVAGDEALQAVADALRACVRESDTTYRWGGDEFAALLPRAGMDAAEAIAQRLDRRLSQLPIAGGPLRINAGGASAPSDGTDLDTLLTCADHRMYHAKSHALVWTGGIENVPA